MIDGLLKHIRNVALFGMMSLLTSCVAAVFAGGVAATGLVVYDARTVAAMETDSQIFYRLKKAILSDPQFNQSRIVIISFNRVVLLLGQTPAASLRVVVERIAQKTPWVVRVYDEVSVKHPISLQQRAEDAFITAKVRSQLIAQKGLASGSIRVVTEDGAVYLMGIVSPSQARLAVETARQVAGVRKVVKVFQNR